MAALVGKKVLPLCQQEQGYGFFDELEPRPPPKIPQHFQTPFSMVRSLGTLLYTLDFSLDLYLLYEYV